MTLSLPSDPNQGYPIGPKSTWQKQAADICLRPINEIEPQITLLLPWLQDYNWPGAQEIGRLLLRVGASVVPHVKEILNASHDSQWKYWLIVVLVCNWPRQFVKNVEAELREFAAKDDDSEIHLVALEALLKYELIDQTEGARMIEAKQKNYPKLQEDIDDLKSLLEMYGRQRGQS